MSLRNWLQLPQFCGRAATGGAGLGVCPAPGSGAAPATGSVDCPASNSPNDSSAELNGLRRDMAVNRGSFGYPRQREKVTP
ncbi:hypothetical protein MHEI_38240 [Mycobacterium heidelbergense]|nr:hypothetical protein MHEI_38240 [Mycobacterium heidelbergense]